MSRILLVCCPVIACAPFKPLPGAGHAQPEPTTTTVDGEIMGVDRTPPGDRLASGVRVTLRTSGSRAVVVDLAPDWYLGKNGLSLNRSERLRAEGVTGASSVLYARRVVQGGKTTPLRNASGQPLWSSK
jgi:hypothetical protein